MRLTDTVPFAVSYVDSDNVRKRFSVGLLEFQKFQICERVGSTADSVISLNQMSISENGISLSLVGDKGSGVLRIAPHDWSEYYAEHSLGSLSGQSAISAYECYFSWHTDCEALQILHKIERGELSFADVKRDHPNPSYLFSHPLIQNCLAHHFLADSLKGKAGKRKKFTSEEIQLYGWANYYYADNPNLSEEAARAKALENFPDKIPKVWAGNNKTNFKKEWERLDIHEIYSQKSYRKRIRVVPDNK